METQRGEATRSRSPTPGGSGRAGLLWSDPVGDSGGEERKSWNRQRSTEGIAEAPPRARTARSFLATRFLHVTLSSFSVDSHAPRPPPLGTATMSGLPFRRTPSRGPGPDHAEYSPGTTVPEAGPSFSPRSDACRRTAVSFTGSAFQGPGRSAGAQPASCHRQKSSSSSRLYAGTGPSNHCEGRGFPVTFLSGGGTNL